MRSHVALPMLFLSIVIATSGAYSQGLLWVGALGGAEDEWARGIVVDGSRNVYLAGHFRGTLDLDPGPGAFILTSAGEFDSFVVKLDPAGNFVWGRQLGGPANEWITSVALDGNGNVLVAGAFEDTVDFDPGPGTFNMTSAGSFDPYLCKLSSAGDFIWAPGAA